MPLHSPHPPVDIQPETIYNAVFSGLTDEDLQRVALIDGMTGEKVTYEQLRGMVHAFAGALAARGFGPGHTVALHCPNSIAFAVAFHGTLLAGATVTTVGALATTEDILKQLKDSGATMMLTTVALGPNGFDAARAAELDPAHIIDLSDTEAGLRALISEGHPVPHVDIDPLTHVAVLPYSSGTTGVPKGVRLSHANIAANIRQVLPSLAPSGLHRDSIVMGVLPFFHIYGMNCLLNNVLSLRATLVTLPKFDLEVFLKAHQDYRITFTFVAPPIAVALAKHPVVDSYTLDSLETVLSGAASLDKDLAEAVATRLGVTVLQGFGMTEASPVTHVSVAGVTPLDSIGHALVNTEYKVVDLSQEDLPEILPPANPGERSAAGEMWVRGPQVMLGYHNNEEATRNTLTEDGWLRTGDIVELDYDRLPYVVDRAKELIKYKGYQVAPAELEALLLTREDVSDVAVVAYRRPDDGEEVPRAFIVPQVDAHGAPIEIDPEELKAWVAERVAPYKKVRMVEFVDAIPKSATGKILRRNLKDLPASEGTVAEGAGVS